MIPHIPAVEDRSQLSWLFFVAMEQLERVTARAEELADRDDAVKLSAGLANLTLALRTLEVMALNVEEALAGVVAVVGSDDGLQEHQVQALQAPARAVLGEWYVDAALAGEAAEGEEG